MAQFDDRGRQVPDPRPVEVPAHFTRPLSIQDEIKRFVRSELAQRAAAEGAETFEEADDFYLDDEDPDIAPGTEYELDDGQESYGVPPPLVESSSSSPSKDPAKPDPVAGDSRAEGAPGGASAPAPTLPPAKGGADAS